MMMRLVLVLAIFAKIVIAAEDPKPFPEAAIFNGWDIGGPADSCASLSDCCGCPGGMCSACALPKQNTFGSAIAGTSNGIIIGAKAYDPKVTTSGKGEVRIFFQDPNGDWPNTSNIKTDPTRVYIWRDPESGANTAESFYGAAVAMSEDYIVVGAYKSNKAYVYYRDKDGNFAQTDLTPLGSGTASQRYGVAVGVNSDTVVVGASQAIFSCGQVFLYKLFAGAPFVAGTNRPKFNPNSGYTLCGLDGGCPTTCADDAKVGFGKVVAITENYLAVSAPSAVGLSVVGTVFIFGRTAGPGSSFSQVILAKLVSLVQNGQFGISLSMTDTELAVGDLSANDQAGEATLFSYLPSTDPVTKKPSIEITHRLVIVGESENIQFGWSVSVSANFFVVGGNFNKVWIYGKDTKGAWSNTLKAVQLGPGGGFGMAVMNSDQWVVVGTPLKEGVNDMDKNTGGAIAYRVYEDSPLNTAILAALVCAGASIFCAVVLGLRFYCGPKGDPPVMDAKSAAKAARLGFQHHNVAHKHFRRKGEEEKETQYLAPQGKNPLRPSGAHLLAKGPQKPPVAPVAPVAPVFKPKSPALGAKAMANPMVARDRGLDML